MTDKDRLEQEHRGWKAKGAESPSPFQEATEGAFQSLLWFQFLHISLLTGSGPSSLASLVSYTARKQVNVLSPASSVFPDSNSRVGQELILDEAETSPGAAFLVHLFPSKILVTKLIHKCFYPAMDSY